MFNKEYLQEKKNNISDFMLELLEYVNDKLEIGESFKCFVAGGACLSSFTNQPIKDYDIYFYTEEDFKLFEEYIGSHATIYCETERAISYNMSDTLFQAIKVFGTPNEIFERFDFNVCMVALPFELTVVNEDGKNEYVVHDFVFQKDFINGFCSRDLKFNTKTLYPLNSLFRLKKYTNKGYKINNAEYLKLCLAVNNLNIKTIGDFKQQVIGVSKELSMRIIDELSRYNDETLISDINDFVDRLDKAISLNIEEV